MDRFSRCISIAVWQRHHVSYWEKIKSDLPWSINETVEVPCISGYLMLGGLGDKNKASFLYQKPHEVRGRNFILYEDDK